MNRLGADRRTWVVAAGGGPRAGRAVDRSGGQCLSGRRLYGQPMAQVVFDEWIAARYETLWPELFDPAVLDPAVDLLAELAGAGPTLEFGVGTGRVALPLSRRGILVRGIELSPAMVARLRAQDGGADIDVIVGDFATATAGAPVALVYLLRNTITNLTSQDAQVQAFGNAAAHLRPGGCFLIENYVPELRRLPPGETTHVFVATADHVGVEKYDVAAQLAVSHHYWNVDGQLRTFSSPTATPGPPNWTSWPGSPGSACVTGGATGSAPRSPARAAATFRSGRSPFTRSRAPPARRSTDPRHERTPVDVRGCSTRRPQRAIGKPAGGRVTGPRWIDVGTQAVTRAGVSGVMSEWLSGDPGSLDTGRVGRISCPAGFRR